MLSLCREMGFTMKPKEDYYEVELSLKDDEVPQPQAQPNPVEEGKGTEGLAQ